MRVDDRLGAWSKSAKGLQRKPVSQRDVKPRCAVPKLKKRRVQRDDAPSNKRYGNCLLGLHCSQKTPLEPAPALDSGSLQGPNMELLSTVYQQCCAGAARTDKQSGTASADIIKPARVDPDSKPDRV
jgi:hypothetical protein